MDCRSHLWGPGRVLRSGLWEGRAGHGSWGLSRSREHSCECLGQQPGRAGLRTGQPHKRSLEASMWKETVVVGGRVWGLVWKLYLRSKLTLFTQQCVCLGVSGVQGCQWLLWWGGGKSGQSSPLVLPPLLAKELLPPPIIAKSPCHHLLSGYLTSPSNRPREVKPPIVVTQLGTCLTPDPVL